MTEKIDGQGFKPTDTAGARRSDGARQARMSHDTGTRPAAQPAETVNLTRSGVLLARLEEALQTLPAVDVERVRAIKDALASGSYEIDDRAIADKLLQLDRELSA
jgi:negative regulator of flagellin synthesis FlgM